MNELVNRKNRIFEILLGCSLIMYSFVNGMLPGLRDTSTEGGTHYFLQIIVTALLGILIIFRNYRTRSKKYTLCAMTAFMILITVLCISDKSNMVSTPERLLLRSFVGLPFTITTVIKGVACLVALLMAFGILKWKERPLLTIYLYILFVIMAATNIIMPRPELFLVCLVLIPCFMYDTKYKSSKLAAIGRTAGYAYMIITLAETVWTFLQRSELFMTGYYDKFIEYYYYYGRYVFTALLLLIPMTVFDRLVISEEE